MASTHNNNSNASNGKPSLFCIVFGSDWTHTSEMQFFIDIKTKKHWNFDFQVVKIGAMPDFDFSKQWKESDIVVVVPLVDYSAADKLPLRNGPTFVYNPTRVRFDYSGNFTLLEKYPAQAVSELIDEAKRFSNRKQPVVLVCFVNNELDAETSFQFTMGSNDFVKCQPYACQDQGSAILERCHWETIDFVVPFVTPGCFKNEYFVWILSEAIKAGKPIVLVHRFDSPFPSRESAPTHVQSVFDYVAVKFLPMQAGACWQKILRRAKQGKEDIRTDIFLSHRQLTGQGIALALYRKLTKMHKRVFLDIKVQFNLHDLKLVVSQTGLFVFILTDNIFDSFWCFQEFKAAVDNKKPVVVVRPDYFTWPTEIRKHWLPYFKQMKSMRSKIVDYDAAYLKYCTNQILDPSHHMRFTPANEGPFTIETVPIEPCSPVPDPKTSPLPIQLAAAGKNTLDIFFENSWRSFDLPNPRGRPAIAAVGKYIYVLGGDGKKGLCERFDLVTQKWNDMPDMTMARTKFGAAVVKGIIYAIGGVSNGKSTSTIEMFEPSSKDPQWKKLDVKLSHPKHFIGVAASEDAIYILGGRDDSKHIFNSIEKFTPADQRTEVLKWTLSPPRNSLSAAYFDGKLYAVGGWSDRYCPLVIIDLSTGKQETFPMKTHRVQTGAVIINRKLIVAGGNANKKEQTTVVECMNLDSKEWTQLPKMPDYHRNLTLF